MMECFSIMTRPASAELFSQNISPTVLCTEGVKFRTEQGPQNSILVIKNRAG